MDINKAAAAMGRIGGKSGTGESKRRSTEHYKKIARISWKKTRVPMIERFWKMVDRKGENECWPWIGYTDALGYGSFNINRKMLKSHRVAYEIHYGVKPKNCVLHKCDNRPCCNPNHLFEGTQADNIKDMDEKGRRGSAKGEAQFCHKLTEQDIVKIRLDTRVHRVIAADYGVARCNISHIKSKKAWKHVP